MHKLKRIEKLKFSSSSPIRSVYSKMLTVNSRTVPQLKVSRLQCCSRDMSALGLLLFFVINVQCFGIIQAENMIFESTTPLTTPMYFETSVNNVTQIENYRNSNNYHNKIVYQSNSSSGNSDGSNPSPNQNRSHSGSNYFTTKIFSTGNDLWDGIIHDCYHRPSFSCFQKNVYTFLNDALETRDVNVTQRLKFYKNQVDYEAAAKKSELMTDDDNEDGNNDDDDGSGDQHLNTNEIPNESRAAESPIEEVTNSLYDKSVKFVMTHDVEMHLPEIIFNGATFRISPRSIEGNGAIVKLELIPKAEIEARSTGKIFKKKIQKFIRSKLLLSFLALLLVIKIIKIKIFWLLPLIIGVSAAKKLLLKFLLFLFPALTHLFKLCSYYQQTYHSTKYHHHHHLINHHHTIVPAWHGDHHGPHAHGPELIYTNPPKGHISTYLHGAPPIHENYHQPSSLHEHYPNDWENSGPGLGSEYIGDINRNANVEGDYFKPNVNDANVLHSWGLGTTPTTSTIQSQQHLQQQHILQQLQQQLKQQQKLQHFRKQSTSHNNLNANTFLSPEQQSRPTTKLKLQGTDYFLNSQPNNQLSDIPDSALSASEIAAQYDSMRNKITQQLSPEIAAQLKEALRIETEKKIIAQQQKILEKQPFVQSDEKIMPKNYDPFYSPILLKVDKIIEQMGVNDEYCKERIVCNMYKNPQRYSPYSNFVSAELSRDTSELQPVTNTNPAVMRFYRLVQAAREGQEQRNCFQLYPQCSDDKMA